MLLPIATFSLALLVQETAPPPEPEPPAEAAPPADAPAADAPAADAPPVDAPPTDTNAAPPAQPAPAVVTPAAPPPAPAPARSGARRVLLLDFRNDGVSPEVVRTVGDLVARRLSRAPQLEVIAASDVRQLVDIEAQKAALACDGTGSCEAMKELAGALGADIIIAGSVGRLGDVVVLSMVAYDRGSATSIARWDGKTRSEAGLADAVDDGTDSLLRAMHIEPPPREGGPPLLLIAGGVVAGMGGVALAIGGVGALVERSVVIDVTPPPNGPTAADKTSAKALGQAFVPIAIVGAGVLLAGAALVAVGMVLE